MRHELYLRVLLVVTFVSAAVMPAHGQSALFFPDPVEIGVSEVFEPVMLKGFRIDPADSLKLDFIFERGSQPLDEQEFRQETDRLTGYFLASLTIAETDMTVNIDPQGVLLKDSLRSTLMGRDMVAQDYVLKLLSASMTNPLNAVGSAYWDTIYAGVAEAFHTIELPVDAFVRVQFQPGTADVFRQDNVFLALESRIRISSEDDKAVYVDDSANAVAREFNISTDDLKKLRQICAAAADRIIIPVLEKEVNEGRNFSRIRQIYQCFVLAAAYKKELPQELIARYYADHEKLAHLDEGLDDGVSVEDIFRKYALSLTRGIVKKEALAKPGVDAQALWDDLILNGYIDTDGVVLEKGHALEDPADLVLDPGFFAQRNAIYSVVRFAPAGIYDFIMETTDPGTGQGIPLKHVSGGVDFSRLSREVLASHKGKAQDLSQRVRDDLRDRKYFRVETQLKPVLAREADPLRSGTPPDEVMRNAAFSGMRPVVNFVAPVNMPKMLGL